ncbi:MAG: hypothetical protein JXB39_08665, partial [Deltaproteobacteria bacterium]|nr:hypothetical protein [Deltaproteobacteria bacterium]
AEVEPARRTAEVESVAPPEPEPEAVPEPVALLEPEPEAVPEPEAEVEPARRTAENEVEPARRTAEPETLLTRSRAPDSAAWLEGVGVTSGSDRDRELGPGKWTEPARSLDEVRAALDAVPIPRADPPPPAPRRPLLLAAAALVVAMLGGLGWWIDRVHRHPAGTVVPVSAPLVPQENAWVDASPAASDAPIATVRAEMAGAVIRLDGRAFGPSPARVLVPLDPGRHELCAEAGERRVCRSVTGEELASHEPFLLSADGSP